MLYILFFVNLTVMFVPKHLEKRMLALKLKNQQDLAVFELFNLRVQQALSNSQNLTAIDAATQTFLSLLQSLKVKTNFENYRFELMFLNAQGAWFFIHDWRTGIFILPVSQSAGVF